MINVALTDGRFLRASFVILSLIATAPIARAEPPSPSTAPIDQAAVSAAMERLNARQRQRAGEAEKSELERLRRENAELKEEIGRLRARVLAVHPSGPNEDSPRAPIIQTPIIQTDDVTLDVGGGRFVISRATDTVYLQADFWAALPVSAISWTFYNSSGALVAPAEGFYEIAGRPSRMAITADNEVVKRDEAGDLIFSKEGHGTVTLSIAGQSASLVFSVRRVPINDGDDSAKVIEKLGMPSTVEQVTALWPDTTSKDGVAYSPTADEYVASGTHWRFDKWPNLVVVIRGGKVFHLVSRKPTSRPEGAEPTAP